MNNVFEAFLEGFRKMQTALPQLNWVYRQTPWQIKSSSHFTDMTLNIFSLKNWISVFLRKSYNKRTNWLVYKIILNNKNLISFFFLQTRGYHRFERRSEHNKHIKIMHKSQRSFNWPTSLPSNNRVTKERMVFYAQEFSHKKLLL